MLNSLDPNQDRRSVGPDLDPICLRKVISSRLNFPTSMQKVKRTVTQL